MRWAGTEYESTTCPRRHLLDHPELGGLLTLYGMTQDGGIGLDLYDRPRVLVDGLSAVASGRAHYRAAEAERQKPKGGGDRR